MDMLALQAALVNVGAPVHIGYAASGSKPPYIVLRPISVLPEDTAICGMVLDWNTQIGAYCVGGGVEACHTLGTRVMRELDGARVAGYAVSTSLGYSGERAGGHYETQITIQNYGGLA